MDLIATLPIWLAALLIFSLRVCDVTLGTMRTVSIVEGRIALSMALGFFEVTVWVVAISQVITRLDDSLWLIVGYACGFTTGNAVGILLERRLALGSVVLRIVSREAGARIAAAFRNQGQRTTVFTGADNGGTVTLLYALCPRREVAGLLTVARSIDSEVFFVIERANQWGDGNSLVLAPTGWRAVFKMK